MSDTLPTSAVIDQDLFEQQRRHQQRRRVVNSAAKFLGLSALCFGVVDVLSRPLGVPPDRRLWVALAVAPVMAAGIRGFLWSMLTAVGRVAEAVLHPPGRTGGAVATSAAEALFAQGNLDGAIAAFDALRRAHGATPHLLRREANLHLLPRGRPERARELLLRLRQAPGATRDDELFATQRLIDLYFGPLDQEARALAEMRRLVERFPGTRDAEGARAELQRRQAAR